MKFWVELGKSMYRWCKKGKMEFYSYFFKLITIIPVNQYQRLSLSKIGTTAMLFYHMYLAKKSGIPKLDQCNDNCKELTNWWIIMCCLGIICQRQQL